MSNRGKNRLVVGCRVDRGELVHTRSETGRNLGRKNTTLGSGVQTLEKGELLRIGGGGLSQRCKLLNHDVRVTLDLPLGVDLLGSREVVVGGVYEKAGLHLRNCHRDGECFVSLNCSKVLGEREFRRRHILCRRNAAHRRRVT